MYIEIEIKVNDITTFSKTDFVSLSQFFFKNVSSVKYANSNVVLYIIYQNLSLPFHLGISFVLPFMDALQSNPNEVGLVRVFGFPSFEGIEIESKFLFTVINFSKIPGFVMKPLSAESETS